MDFEKNGIHFHAVAGYAYAKKDGKKLWRALDVFRSAPPTKDAVLALHTALMPLKTKNHKITLRPLSALWED